MSARFYIIKYYIYFFSILNFMKHLFLYYYYPNNSDYLQKPGNTGISRHIRTSKEIIRNLLNDYDKSFKPHKMCTLGINI